MILSAISKKTILALAFCEIMRLLSFEEVGDVNDVCLVDEAGKVLGKVLLILRHVAQFWIPEVVHETFSEHVHEVVEHAFSFLFPKVAITSVHFLRSPILRM